VTGVDPPDPLRPQGDVNVPYPLTIHPPTRAVVLPSSHSSTLQFVDPLSSSVLFDLEVAPSNRVSRRDDKELEPVSIEHVAFNDAIENGHDRWMATVEGRKGDELEGGGLVKNLKIWKWQNEKYSISTQFPRPHGSADVTKVVFSSSTSSASSSSGSTAQPYLLTASADGTAKLWQVRQVKKPEAGEYSLPLGLSISHFTMTKQYTLQTFPQPPGHADQHSAILTISPLLCSTQSDSSTRY
jgi:NET1-associated nuclear protein 1 (U3 small nucleolar RNA-associated protein 17)